MFVFNGFCRNLFISTMSIPMFILSNFLYSRVKSYLFLSNALHRILFVMSLTCRQIAASFQQRPNGDYCFGQVRDGSYRCNFIVILGYATTPLSESKTAVKYIDAQIRLIFLSDRLQLNSVLWTPNQNTRLNSQITSSIPFSTKYSSATTFNTR